MASSTLTVDTGALSRALAGTSLSAHAPEIARAAALACAGKRHGDLPRWQLALDQLPDLHPTRITLDASTVSADVTAIPAATEATLRSALQQLAPWRKGPFRLGNVVVDTEWRSDWKWDRVLPHLQPLSGRTVLDVGCGSGYHCWRMRGAGADSVIGIDPGYLFVLQFRAMQRYLGEPSVQVLPMTLADWPQPARWFDTVFSMGVLYHRKDPHEHLGQLLGCLRPGGELVLETLVSPASDDSSLALPSRYARMRNLSELPSPARVERWLQESGFADVRTVDINVTQIAEQRTTDWMTFESLAAALDPENDQLTVEGLPRPRRAIILATAAQTA